MKPDGGHSMLEKRPTVTPPQELRRVVVVILLQGETIAGVRVLHRGRKRASAPAEESYGILIRGGRLHRKAAESRAAVLGDLFVPADHIHVDHCHCFLERNGWRFGVAPRSHQRAALS